MENLDPSIVVFAVAIFWLAGIILAWAFVHGAQKLGSQQMPAAEFSGTTSLRTVTGHTLQQGPLVPTPGPQYVEVIDGHSGRPDGKSSLICDVARTRWGNNSIDFGEDEATARFVAAAFTDVDKLGAALRRANAQLATMERMLTSGQVTVDYFEDATQGLRKALILDGDQ